MFKRPRRLDGEEDLLGSLVSADDHYRSGGEGYEFLAEPMIVEIARRILELERRLNEQDGNSDSQMV